MMGMLWLVLFVALTGAQPGQGLPLRSTPHTYPHETSGESLVEAWGSGGLYAAVAALALVLTAVGFLLGCTWCYRHKDCKLFTASATQLSDGRRPPDSGFPEPANNNISEDNNNGPISLREMQNIANNNAAAYIVSENEERNRVSRESVVEFEPLPSAIRVADPLEHCADWFGGEDLPRSRLQYLREIGRGWFGRVVEGEIDEQGATSSVAVRILNQNASLEEKARFLDEARMYRDVTHENILAFIAKCLHEEPWILMFELCSMDLQQYLIANRSKMAALNASGVPLQFMCDVASALAYLHSRGYLYGNVSCATTLVRECAGAAPRAVLGSYAAPQHAVTAPETRRHPSVYTSESEVWSLGGLLWEVCAGGEALPAPPPPPALHTPYRDHLYQVMQLCWNPDPMARPTASQVQALLNHLRSHTTPQDEHTMPTDFEERWQTLKPNTIPKVDEHIAQIHAPSTSMVSHFTASDQDFDNAPTTQDTLSIDMDTAVSRSSSIMSDKDMSVQIKSESLTNLHGSLEDVRNIYLTHNETPLLECHQGNIGLEDSREKDQDRSDSSVDPWVKDLIAGSQDDVSYYKDVSDVIKNLDNILNSEKTSSSESSHQASPSRDNLSLDCKKDYPVQSSMVKSPGITNFKNILEMGFENKEDETCEDDDVDKETIGTLSHSFERHSDTTSQHTLENLTPDTPLRDLDFVNQMESQVEEDADTNEACKVMDTTIPVVSDNAENEGQIEANKTIADESPQITELPKQINISHSKLPKLKDLCVVSLTSVSKNEQLIREDCVTPCDNNLDEIRTEVIPKSIDNTVRNDQQISEEKLLGEAENTVKCVEENKSEINLNKNDKLPHTNGIQEEEKSVQIAKDTMNDEEILTKEKVIENNHVQEILPICVSEFAKNLVENEVIQPAIEIVSEMVGEKDAKVDLQEEVVAKIDVRENQTENVKPIENLSENHVNVSITQVTCTLLEEERKVATEPLLQNEIVHELKIEESTSIDNQDVPTKPEPVQINDKNSEDTPNSTEKSECFQSLILPQEVQTILDTEDKQKEYVLNGDRNEINIDDLSTITNYSKGSIRSDNIEENQYDSTAYMDLINYTNSGNVNSEILQENVKDFINSCLENTNVENNCSIVKNESTVYLDLPNIVKETHDFLQSERVTSQTEDKICASTPKGSECSNTTLEGSVKDDLSETKIPEETTDPMVKSEQRQIRELLSPFESPTRSHPTDTYDENSSVVLGPFENCVMEFKGVKDIEIPKEELLAFSSNFSEMNLETPSPLRDVNFLNEVPDIVMEDDVTISEVKKEETLPSNTDETDESATAKHVSPSTPPNSPGIYLASTSQYKYMVDIHFEPEPLYPPIESIQSDSGLSSLQKEIDLNQIEIQITSKLAMAENENNMNIEYSGPLTVEGLVSEDEAILRESEAIPETVLAGNGGSLEDHSEGLTLDEECVKALRNELELKLPLAQVSCIEPASEPPASSETVAEREWLPLPLPAPELVLHYAAGALSPIAEETRHQLSAYENDHWVASIRTDSSESYPEPCNDSTAEVTDLPTAAPSSHSTYTIHTPERDHDTYTVHKDIPSSKEPTMSADSLNGSPFKKPTVVSPVDDRTYNKDDEKISNCERISQISPFLMSPTTDTSAPESVVTTGVSTLSKTTVPTDAKHSKPSECLSKATSIDSWCSNDTLYNVEENFDDLMDADVPFEAERDIVKSASTETLHAEDDKEVSHCSTYIIHDSKSEQCETFSPDSITANDNCTYTKVKTEVGATPSVPTTEVNDSTKNTTKDLAYGTLPTYSNCTTEIVSSIDDPWKIAQPEMVRRSPVLDELTFTPPRIVEDKEMSLNESPQGCTDPINRMESVEITCLQDDMNSHKSESSDSQILVDLGTSSYNDMAPSSFSTPIAEVNNDDNVQAIPMTLPNESMSSLNFNSFVQSAEIRPQDITCFTDRNEVTDFLLEGESKTLSKESNRDSFIAQRTPTSSEFENSVVLRAQEVHSRDPSSLEMSSQEFRNFENSVRACPQDLSSLIDTNSLFLNSERKSSDEYLDATGDPCQSRSLLVEVSPPNDTNLTESHIPHIIFSMFVTDLDEDENEQPHSIIITDITAKDDEVSAANEPIVTKTDTQEVVASPNVTFDSHVKFDQNNTFNSHNVSSAHKSENDTKDDDNEPKVNGVDKIEEGTSKIEKSPKTEQHEDKIDNIDEKIPNGSITEDDKVTAAKDSEANYAVVNFISDPFEELIESNVDDKEIKENHKAPEVAIEVETPQVKTEDKPPTEAGEKPVNGVDDKVNVTKELISEWIENEKKFCTDSYLPLLSDIRFTGPASEIMSTSFSQESPTEPASPECEQDKQDVDIVADIVKEWDSDTESHSSNSSSGEFIWKDGDGHETAVVPSSHFQHQQSGGHHDGGGAPPGGAADAASGSGDSGSGSGSEGDEVEFVPSSWDCSAAPAKSSLRSLEQTNTDSKKRVVFKRQKYHCVYEYPRDSQPLDSPHAAPDLSTYCDWDPSSAEEAALGYGRLYGAPLDLYQLRAGISFGTDYDEDFFISSSARPFESLGVMSSSSQFFPGMHVKPMLDHDDDVTHHYPAPPEPLITSLPPTRTPSLDFTTPDSGVEDITPGSTSTDEDFKTKKLPESDVPCWKPVDSGSSSESVSPSSPGGEALGGLRHTRDKLKLDLPPSPHIPSPRHNRVFNFVLDKPKRHRVAEERSVEVGSTPLVMTDDTPLVASALPIQADEDAPPPEPTFSTFGKCKNQTDPDSEQKIVLDEVEEKESPNEVKEESPVKVEPVKGEGTVLDSGDEDSGIESSSKATLERKTNVS